MKKLPQCIGIILDGNRRWARERWMPTLEGHRQGLVVALKGAIRSVRDRNIPHLAVFMLSTENWNRSEEEVTYLLNLFREAVKEHFRELVAEGVRIRFAGQRERFPEDLQRAMVEIEAESAHNTALTVWACLSYGGRAEIVTAAEALRIEGKEITAESLRSRMWTAEMPDPDIIVRTGGDKRLSGFLLWQSEYSELFFIDTKWPDFGDATLDAILAEYTERERRHGK